MSEAEEDDPERDGDGDSWRPAAGVVDALTTRLDLVIES
jgi:hypothetical protein